MALAECCEIVSGATPSTAVEAYWDGEVCWATPKDLSDLDGHYISDTPRKLTAEGLSSCAAYVLPPNSVLFSSRAPIGHVAINTVPMATNQGFKSLVPKAELIDAKFLFHWLRANRSYLESLGVGATFKEVSKAIVSKIKVPVPDISEQRRIATILDQADALRAKRREALALLDELQRGIFIEMFGDPKTNSKSIKKAPIGELLKLKSGDFLPSTSMAINGNYPVFGGNGINGYHDEFMFDERKIVIGRVGVYCGCVHVTPAKSWVTDNALFVREYDSSLEFDYLAFALKQAQLNQYASQSAQPLISSSRVYPVEIFVPPKAKQLEFIELTGQASALEKKHIESSELLDKLFLCIQSRGFRGET